MTTGERGATPPDAENYLDLSGVAEESSGPHFDVVLRGYDRRQVDDHVAGLRRMVSQLRAQLAVRERRRAPAAGPEAGSQAGSETVPEGGLPTQPGPDARTAGTSGAQPDMVGAFNDRLRGILQAAEQEAQSVRSRAAESLLAEHADSRAALADLRSQRDAVFDELMRTKARLDDLVSHAGRPSGHPYGGGGRPWGGQGPGSRGPYAGPGGPRNGGGPGGNGGVPGGGPPTWGAEPRGQQPTAGGAGGAGAGTAGAADPDEDADADATGVDAETAGDHGSTIVALEPVHPDAVLSRRAGSDRSGDSPSG